MSHNFSTSFIELVFAELGEILEPDLAYSQLNLFESVVLHDFSKITNIHFCMHKCRSFNGGIFVRATRNASSSLNVALGVGLHAGCHASFNWLIVACMHAAVATSEGGDKGCEWFV